VAGRRHGFAPRTARSAVATVTLVASRPPLTMRRRQLPTPERLHARYDAELTFKQFVREAAIAPR
jgi:tRNA1(Val) A37 N6-methylase TrmN6